MQQFVKHLSKVMSLFEILLDRMKTEQVFEEQMYRFLELCSIPPILTKSSDILEYDKVLKDYFSWMGYALIWLEEKKHQEKISNALYSLLTQKYPEREYMSLAARKEMASKSYLPYVLADLLKTAEEDIYLEILKTVDVFIKGSPETCGKFLMKGAVDMIITRLEPTWRKRLPNVKPQMPLGVEEVPMVQTIFFILKTLLEEANLQNMPVPTKFAFWSLQWALRLFTVVETSTMERNNILCVLLLIMDLYPNALLGNMTLSYDIAMLAMSKDVAFSPNWIAEIKLTTSAEDHCFMSLLLMCLYYLPDSMPGAKVIEECRVVMGLLKIIGNQQAIKWHPLHVCYLMRLALNILYKIVPVSTEEFIEDGGPLLILQMLNRARENRDMYSYDIVLRSIELLSELSHKFKTVRDSIAFNGGVYCILHLCQNWLSSTKTLNEEYQVVLGMGISLLQEICCIAESCRVLPLIVEYMNRYVNPNEMEQMQNPKLIIICVSYIWNNITCSKVNSKEFVSMGGVFLMLDVAQIGCLPVKLVVLGALIDLCEQVECVPYLITWRRNDQGILALLMEIFRQENKQLVVKTDENGIMSNYLYPLMGKLSYYETYCICKNHFGNAAIADLFVSCRPKVYCLLQILNTKQAETVEVANEFYKVYGGELSVIDKVTNILAENFLSLKLGETWREIQKDLKRNDIEPIVSDAAVLQIMIEITDKWAQDLQCMQKEIVNGYMVKQRKKEETLYHRLNESNLADAWDALTEMKYIARCSERYFRLSSNMQLHTHINESLKYNEENGPLHRTLQSNINVTCLRNQNVSFATEIDEDSKESDLHELVSPIGSNSLANVSIPYDDPRGEYLSEEIPKFGH